MNQMKQHAAAAANERTTEMKEKHFIGFKLKQKS